MPAFKTHTRKYGDLKVEVRRKDNGRPTGPIDSVIFTRPDDGHWEEQDQIQITADQLWNLIDLAGVVDPDEFARRFPDNDNPDPLQRLARHLYGRRS